MKWYIFEYGHDHQMLERCLRALWESSDATRTIEAFLSLPKEVRELHGGPEHDELCRRLDKLGGAGFSTLVSHHLFQVVEALFNPQT